MLTTDYAGVIIFSLNSQTQKHVSKKKVSDQGNYL